MHERMLSTINAFYRAISDLDLEAWVLTFAEDAENHDPVGRPPMRGMQEFRAFFEIFPAMFRSLDARPDFIALAGTEAAVKWSARAETRTGR
ncbi:MAG: nuclear transport factor 2 family protein, partial [Candidatus Eremiobacterota bacterium]